MGHGTGPWDMDRDPAADGQMPSPTASHAPHGRIMHVGEHSDVQEIAKPESTTAIYQLQIMAFLDPKSWRLGVVQKVCLAMLCI